MSSIYILWQMVIYATLKSYPRGKTESALRRLLLGSLFTVASGVVVCVDGTGSVSVDRISPMHISITIYAFKLEYSAGTILNG